MDQSIYTGLINNTALLLVLTMLYDVFILRWQQKRTYPQKIITGILVGSICIGVMLNPWQLAPGTFFDTRSVLLSIAGLYIGTVPAITAAVMAGALRIFQGGSGMHMGVLVIITTMLIGLLWRNLRREKKTNPRWIELYVFGIIVHVDMLLCTFVLPGESRLEILNTIAVPVMVVYPLATMLLGMLMNMRADQQKLDNRLRESEASMAAVALENANLLKDATVRLNRVQALLEIDNAINANFDLNLTFTILLEEAVKQLNADAADILLFDEATYTLEYAAGRGFLKTKFPNYPLKPGEGLPGRAVISNQTVTLTDFSDIVHTGEQNLLKVEEFKTYTCTPMMVKGRLVGVLEIFHRSEFAVDEEWINFLDVLAAQAATAVDNSRLFSDLQRSNMNLRLAYDATIEGWSRAMDLRDKETEGHTQRVTQITVRMARAMGLSDEEIAQARRGALLHDIGKMGVPDNILLKPGKLTPEERVLIEKHPVYAREMLEPIDYLRGALDIPYNHHERWDGSGYPQGLKGEQIPLVARIFAVIDVWDALVSDRPYRAAWPPKKVVAYIQENSGILFDPKVVEVFLGIVDELKEVR